MRRIQRQFTREVLTICLVCAGFLICYFLFSFTSFYLNTSSQFAEISEIRKNNLESVSANINYFINEDPSKEAAVNCAFKDGSLTLTEIKKARDLGNLLYVLTKIGNVNFSVLKYKGTTIFTTRGTSFLCGIDEALEADYIVSGKTEVLSSVMLRTTEAGNFKVTVGIPILGSQAVLQEFLDSIGVFFNDSLSLTLLFAIFVFYYLSDFIFLYSLIGKSNWRQLLIEKANSEQSKSLVQFVGSILRVNEELATKNEKLQHGFETAYLRHIDSDQFQKKLAEVVYVELDWKDHTPYVLRHGLAEVVEIKNSINHIGRVIVSRYHGLVLEAKSDMVSFIVERGTLLENKLAALASIRDFFFALTHLEKRLVASDIKIRYRGTLIVGDFEFQATDHNYNLNSEVYYIASRLSKVSNVPVSHLTILEKDIEGLSALADFSELQTKELKGLGNHSYRDVREFKAATQVLHEKNYGLLKYFRSEEDLIAIMQHCTEAVGRGMTNDVELILRELRDFHLDEFITTDTIPEVYLEFCRAAAHGCDENALATIAGLSKSLFSANMDNQAVIEHFKRIANTEMPRFRANLVEACNELTSYQDQEWNAGHWQVENNRVQGNVIIGACQDQISDFYQEKIMEFLRSSNDLYVASGIYVMGHLYRLFYFKNKVYFATNDWFRIVPKEIEKFTLHGNPIIKTRAQIELARIRELG
jgi:hypothetical protein